MIAGLIACESPIPTTVTVSPATSTLESLDQTVRMMAEVEDQNGEEMRGVSVTWSSSAAGVATVDGTGLVTSVGNGTATIRADADGASGTVEVTVRQRVAEVRVTPEEQVLVAIEDTVRFGAEAVDANGYPVGDAPSFLWSSSDTAIAVVDTVGRVEATGVGRAVVTAAAGHGVEGTAILRVEQVADSIVIAPSVNTVMMDDTVRFMARVFDANGHEIPDAEVGWTSSDPDIAGVDETGRCWGVTEGSAVIVATVSIPGNDPRGSAEIVVVNPDRITLAVFYRATAGHDWIDNTGWLSEGPLDKWHGVWTDDRGWVDSLRLAGNELHGRIPPELGSLTHLEALSLGRNRLTGTIPSELGKLANLENLTLGWNSLWGTIPPELGNLANLGRLDLMANNLSGALPQSFLQLEKLESLYLRWGGDEELCVPGSPVFFEWLEEVSGSWRYCNWADHSVLGEFHRATGGDGWTNSEGWRVSATSRAYYDLGNRYGVAVDSLGMVTSLDLAKNGLRGRVLPGVLSELSELKKLEVGRNDLSGRLPMSLTRLELAELRYADTDLCAPAESDFQAWLDSIPLHEGTGIECSSLTDRRILEIFYEATSGPSWTRSDNWMTDAPLSDWHGVETDADGRVIELSLWRNRLNGRIPAEIGDLSRLTSLWLTDNQLKGHIPPSLGKLEDLEVLALFRNGLSGGFPRELTDLGNLRTLGLGGTGRMAIGRLTPKIGNLRKLTDLYLSWTGITGPIPPEIRSLVRLRILDLSLNDLSGPVPSELGELTRLWSIELDHNPRLRGGLYWSKIDSLRYLAAEDTGLCVALGDPAIRDWFEGIGRTRVDSCDPASAYLVQAVQTRNEHETVPLVAGDWTLLRVFPVAAKANTEPIPAMTARFYLDGREVRAVEIPRGTSSIPTVVNEERLDKSANTKVPADVVKPGLEVVIELDSVDASLGVPRRIPAKGRMQVPVHSMPTLALTLVPFLYDADPDSSIIPLIDSVAAAPEEHWVLNGTRKLLPVGPLDAEAHKPVTIDRRSGYAVLYATAAIWVAEGRKGHYMGMMPWFGDVGGVAYHPGRVSASVPSSKTVAHELGHNMVLGHAPCGGPRSIDPQFPNKYGWIGSWGATINQERLVVVHPDSPDVMGYCRNDWWISGYNVDRALRHRLKDEGVGESRPAPAPKSLLLSGGTGPDGTPFLEPAFVLDAPPVLPDGGGAYRLNATAADGRELFSLSFDMDEIADGDGRGGFAFAVPLDPSRASGIASVMLSGPGGATTLDSGTNRPSALVRDSATGQVTALMLDLPDSIRTADEACEFLSTGQSDVLRFSRGLPVRSR